MGPGLERQCSVLCYQDLMDIEAVGLITSCYYNCGNMILRADGDRCCYHSSIIPPALPILLVIYNQTLFNYVRNRCEGSGFFSANSVCNIVFDTSAV